MSKENFENFLTKFQELQAAKKSFVVATLVHQNGSSPQNEGARAIVSLEGLEFGTVGGGKVEQSVIANALDMIRQKTPTRFVSWNLQKDIGMTCGGVVNFFFEFFEFKNSFHIAVFGAGHIAQEFIPLLLKLDCEITCYDSRPEWLAKLPQNKKLTPVHTEQSASFVSQIPDQAYVTIMTMGHGTDLPILKEAMKQKSRFSYVGNIGSEQKALRLREDLKNADIPIETIKQLHCPMGEPFGNNSPIEISFSIIAQILKIKDQHLSEKLS